MSSFQVRRAVPTSCVITFQLTPSYHASHAITSSLSCHPCSLRVWILLAWLFCDRTSPRYSAFCVSHHLCSLFGLRVGSALVVLVVLPASICFCDKTLPLPSTFLPSPEAPLRAIPAVTATIIYASHRSKHVLPSFLLCWSILHFLFFTCSFPPLFCSSHILIAMCFPFFLLSTFTEH